MSNTDQHQHFVCTLQEAVTIINGHRRFWVCNGGCRERRGFCTRSRLDLCLMFRDGIDPTGSGKREISYIEVENILDEAHNKHLVARPFRDMVSKRGIDGICFCCDDCCGYFLNKDEICDRGAFVEKTIFDDCTHYGICVEVCYFGGREMCEGNLLVHNQNCYGCGLCCEICPEECIIMKPRGRELL
mgnify:CR=1 FL=1